MTRWRCALSLCLLNQTRLDSQGVVYSRQRRFNSRLDLLNPEIHSFKHSRVRPLQCLSLLLSLLLNHVASNFWKELATLTSHQENGVICLALSSVGDSFSPCSFGVQLPGSFYHKVIHLADHGKPVDVILDDFSRAFETVSDCTLLGRMFCIRIDRNRMWWLSSWPIGEVQMIRVNRFHWAGRWSLSGFPRAPF